MQCSLKYDINSKTYVVSDNNKIPVEAKTIFADIIKDQKIFNNNIPLFCSEKPYKTRVFLNTSLISYKIKIL